MSRRNDLRIVRDRAKALKASVPDLKDIFDEPCLRNEHLPHDLVRRIGEYVYGRKGNFLELAAESKGYVRGRQSNPFHMDQRSEPRTGGFLAR